MKHEKRRRDSRKTPADPPQEVTQIAAVSARGAPTGAFARHAAELASHGLAVMPVTRNKTPRFRGFNKWRGLPTPKRIEDWSKDHGDQNIGIITGELSGLTVVDVDNLKDRSTAIERYGDTPFEVRTHQGVHLYYRYNGEHSLSVHDLAVDIKGKGGYVVAPYSIHSKGEAYQISRGTLDDLSNLPTIQEGALPSAFSRTREVRDADGRVRKGMRNNTLWRSCMRQARHVDDFNDLLDAAYTENETYDPPLDDAEVVRVAGSAWRYTEAGLNAFGGEPCSVIPKPIILALIDNGRLGERAHSLIARLQVEHGFRQGAPFFLANTTRKRHGWSPYYFRKVRQFLEDHNVIVCVVRGRRGNFAIPQYRLNPHWDWTIASDQEPKGNSALCAPKINGVHIDEEV